jgi:hypothetical protein
VFHIDTFLEHQPAAPISLPTAIGMFGREREDTFGELDVRALLAAFKVGPRDRIATGWGGGKTAVYRDPNGRQAVVLRLDWDNPADADEWAAAVPAYLANAFGAGAADVAFQRAGTHTVLVFGPDAASANELAGSTLAG